MKSGIILATLLFVTGSAFAADLSGVGSTGVEAIADYNYARSINTPTWQSQHQALVGVQANFGGLGSVALQAGNTQRVTNFRLNYTTFALSYANGFRVGKTNVVGMLQYADETGDRWTPFDGDNSSLPISNLIGTVEVNTPVTKSVKAFADYSYGYAWSGNINSFYKNYAVDSANHSSTAAVGAYLDLSKRVVGKIGYARGFGTANPNTQGVVANLSYRF